MTPLWTSFTSPYPLQQLGHSQKEYEKCVLTFSVKNQVRFRGNLVRQVRRDEKKYYSDLIAYSRQSLMLFPYHLSDVVVKGLLLTPFQYYSQMMEALMAQERSYDSLPNFTAADCKAGLQRVATTYGHGGFTPCFYGRRRRPKFF